MSWKRRILELTLAGGLLAAGAGGCDDGPTVPLCNANPDPCCLHPDSDACKNRDLSVPLDMATPRDLTPAAD